MNKEFCLESATIESVHAAMTSGDVPTTSGFLSLEGVIPEKIQKKSPIFRP